MGFMGKWIIFYATLQAGQAWLAIALAVASIISIYYYLRVVWMMCFTDPESARPLPPARSAAGVWIVLSASLAATVLFGLAPGLARSLMDAAATVLRP